MIDSRKRLFRSLFLSMSLLCLVQGLAARETVDEAWLQRNLKQDAPRLFWREGDEEMLRQRVQEDPLAKSLYDYVMGEADAILEVPTLERVQKGRRILQVSRSALKRATTLSFAWRLSKDERYLRRLEALLTAVSDFSDWNPSHFLDVAEMSLGVAIALDWTGEDLHPEVRVQAKDALMEFGLKAGEAPEVQYVYSGHNNWNQVCNTGMVAAALVLADEDPGLAARVINRMVETLPTVLATYGPDGVYVEGAMYWSYGTRFNVALYDMLETAIGTDFGLDEFPGFMESASFVQLLKAPSGNYFNYYDSRLRGGYLGALLWFAMKTGEPGFVMRKEILDIAKEESSPSGSSGRLVPVQLLWYLRYQEGEGKSLPLNWYGRGENPIGIFRSAFDDPNALYLGFKGGKASNHHGNMDAGSFVLELNGVRWAMDPGNQSYGELEAYFAKHGGTLWASAQDSMRWELLTKNNFGHSTLTLDEQLHVSDGKVDIVAFDADRRIAELDLSEVLGPKVEKAIRRFSIGSQDSVLVEDEVQFASEAREVRWQMLSDADVQITEGGAFLAKDGERLKLEVLKPEGVQISVIALDPPPHPMDKRIEGLKRIDVRVPAYLANEAGELKIAVRLSAVGE